MYPFAIAAFAMLPFLVGAVPVSPNPSPTTRIPLTKKLNFMNDDGSVNTNILDAGIHHTRERFKRAHDLYEGKSSTPLERTHSNERRSDVLNWVSLTNHTNVQWTGNIGVGNPSQSIKVVFDTLFADMFVLGDGCSACANMNLDLYDIGSSTTAVDQHQSITDFFDLGIISGDLVMEDVNVAGFQARQRIVVATSTSTSFQIPSFDGSGLVGLGLSAASVLNNSESFFGNLLLQDGFQSYPPIIGFILSDADFAELIIGATDDSQISGEMTFIKLNSLGYWQIPLEIFTVNGIDITLTTTDTVIDSASAFITADSNTIANIYRNIPNSAPFSENSSQYTIPCDTNVPISVTYSGTVFNIPPSSYIIGPVYTGSSDCIGGFAILDTELDPVVMHMGLVFMNNLYTQLDIENLQIGLAQLVVPGPS